MRWDPAGYASRELAERAELALPPAVRMASVTGPRDAVDTVLVAGSTSPDAGGARPGAGRRAREEGALEPRRPRARARARARRARRSPAPLAASLAVRSARREGGTVRVQLDPADLG